MPPAGELPNYEENLRRKDHRAQQPHTPPTVSRMAGMVDNLGRELQAPDPVKESASASGTKEAPPIPAEVRPTKPRTSCSRPLSRCAHSYWV